MEHLAFGETGQMFLDDSDLVEEPQRIQRREHGAQPLLHLLVPLSYGTALSFAEFESVDMRQLAPGGAGGDAGGVVWYVYVARCADDTLYCGIARDVGARIAAHDAGTGARYTRGRGPLRVVLVRRCVDKGRALRLEYAIKQLSRAGKEALVAAPARVARLGRRRAARDRTGSRAVAAP